jgi:hypothetical protein
MSLTIFHYIAIALTILTLLLGVVAALKQNNKKLLLPMIFSSILVSALVGSFGLAVAEKYTKKVKLISIDNRRYLSQEKISYFGRVKNVGKYPVAKVYISIKLVNGGHATGRVKGGNFYQANSGFFNIFSGANKLYKPQSIEKEFFVARNLPPGASASFRVTFDYPGYFKNTADFVKVYAH